MQLFAINFYIVRNFEILELQLLDNRGRSSKTLEIQHCEEFSKKPGCLDGFQLFLTRVDFKADEKLLTMQEIMGFENFLAMLDFNLH